MLAKVEQIGENVLPKTKEGQNQNIQTEFLDAFEKEQSDIMKRILQAGTYIPQEILSLEDF